MKGCSSWWLITCQDATQEIRHKQELDRNEVCLNNKVSIQISERTFLIPSIDTHPKTCTLEKNQRLQLLSFPERSQDNTKYMYVRLKAGQLKDCTLGDGLLLESKFQYLKDSSFIGFPTYGSGKPSFEEKRAVGMENQKAESLLGSLPWKPLTCEDVHKLELLSIKI